MSVLVEATSVLVRIDAITNKFSGGFDAFESAVPSDTLCVDNEIAGVGFMTPVDVEAFVKKLERNGSVYQREGQAMMFRQLDSGHKKTTAKVVFSWTGWSGRQDLNMRLLRPEFYFLPFSVNELHDKQ